MTFWAADALTQTNWVLPTFPEGTVPHANLPYQDDTLHQHLLDIYLPPEAREKVRLVIWIHGGFCTTTWTDPGPDQMP